MCVYHTEKSETSRLKNLKPQAKLPAFALCLLTAVVYANSFGAGMVLDNKGLLLEDPRLRAASDENIAQILDRTYWWPKGESGLYRPVTTLSYLFNYSVLGNGEDPAGYHAVNLLLQCVNVLLAYALALRLWREFWLAWFTAALWAAHPVLTESVTNIVGRADLLAGAAVLGGLLLYLKSVESSGRRRWVWLGALAAVSATGMFAKEGAAVLPAVILLYEVSRRRMNPADLARGCAATLLPLAWMLAKRAAVLSASGAASFPYTDNPLVAADFWTRQLTAAKVMGLYLGLLAWPAKLSADYSFNQIPLARSAADWLASGSAADWLAWSAVAAVAAIAAIAFQRRSPAFFWIAFAFVTLLPASNVLFPVGTIMAERLLYLPALAMAACVAGGVYAALRIRRSWAPVLLGVLTAALGARTLLRNADWHSNLTLATATVNASPESYKAHKMLADALFTGDETHANLDRAIAEAERSVAIVSAVPDARNNAQAFRMAAGFYLLKGDLIFQRELQHTADPPPDARAAYAKALPLALRNQSILEKSGAEKSVADAGASLEDAQELLSAIYLRTGEAVKALQAAEAAQHLAPLKSALYRQLADALLANGRADDAAVALTEGALATSDQTLRARLMELYQGGLDREGCALVTGPNGPAINPRCTLVKDEICRAAPLAVQALNAGGKADEARRLGDMMTHDSGCPPR